MTTAVVDTTVLVDALLKPTLADKAKSAIALYDPSHLPEYALKELSEGPLWNFVWVHNQLALGCSHEAMLTRLAAMARTPRRYLTSTACEALREVAAQFKADHQSLGDMVRLYGEDADPDRVIADRFLFSLRALIMKAWRKRTKLTSSLVGALPCRQDHPPVIGQDGTIKLPTKVCNRSLPCGMAALMRSDLKRSRDLLKALESGASPSKTETTVRAEALREVCRKRAPPISDKLCRAIGDAAFAFLCPRDGVVLTTNVRDHEPLAQALGHAVVTPAE